MEHSEATEFELYVFAVDVAATDKNFRNRIALLLLLKRIEPNSRRASPTALIALMPLHTAAVVAPAAALRHVVAAGQGLT